MLLAFVESITFSQLIGFDPGVPAGDQFFAFPTKVSDLSYVWLFLLPAVGGLLSGLIIYFFCPEAAGGGTDSLIQAFHFNEGKISAKLPFFKTLVTILTLGSGGSGGKEGPTAQIGAGSGST